jgi:hypothetical protein
MTHGQAVKAVMRVAARLAALATTLCVLVATSPAPVCDEWTAPVAFLAEGTCGSGGAVVVTADGYNGRIELANGAALGIAPNTTGNYVGSACPMTLARGEWTLSTGSAGSTSCTAPDAGASDAGTTTTPCPRTCTAAAPVPGGPLRFSCTDSSGNALCESILTVIE